MTDILFWFLIYKPIKLSCFKKYLSKILTFQFVLTISPTNQHVHYYRLLDSPSIYNKYRIIILTMKITIWVILYFCYALQIYWMLARIGNFKFYTALLYPIPLLFFVIVFIYSFILIFIRRRVQWKGRELDIKGGGSNVIPSSDSHNDLDWHRSLVLDSYGCILHGDAHTTALIQSRFLAF